MNHPLLLIHGEDDRVINASHGRALFAASPSATIRMTMATPR